MSESSGFDARPVPLWLTSDRRMRVPDTSMLPGAGNAPPATAAAVNRVVHAAHDVVDRFADKTAPRVRQLGESAVEGLRTTVRHHPLAAMAAAVALGALIVRAMR